MASVILATLAFCVGLEGLVDTPQTNEERPALRETVVVTAARRSEPVGDAVALVSLISAEDLAFQPNLALDDQLRHVPGFSLFRRSGSLAAHPTSQGLSLRGVGPSGTSRSLVLFDGVPLNDPFGGWIYWNRVPELSLGGIEVVRGATSHLYGSSALGGTVQFLSREAEPRRMDARAQAGSRGTYDAALHASHRSGDWGYTLGGRVLSTEGYYLVEEDVRGAVDTPADVSFQSALLRVSRGGFHAGWNGYSESRHNGTQLQRNRSRLSTLETGYQTASWNGSFYWQPGHFESTFSRILTNRSAESLTEYQDVRSTGVGGSVSWKASRDLLVGADARRVSWEDKEQNLYGAFVQRLIPVARRLDLLAAVRLDRWENRRPQTALDPRIGALLRASESLTLRASAYRGFRAPTLNELYRPFRVGNRQTLPNPDLADEALVGAEGGFDLHPSRHVLVRVNAFWNSLRNSVGSVTLSTSPALILLQRQNLGPSTIRGLEAETIWRGGAWQGRAAYLYSQARVDATRLRLPQVPLHQGSVGLTYMGAVQATADLRWVGAQYDDDLNTLRLGEYALLDLTLRRRVSSALDVFVSVENALDRAYVVGKTPVNSLGAPRLIRGGLDLRLP